MPKRKRPSRRSVLTYAGLVALGLVTAGVIGVAVNPPTPDAPTIDVAAADAKTAAVQKAFEDEQKAEADATFLPLTFPKDRPLKVLYVGDSLGNGYAATSPPQFFRNIVTAKLSERGRVDPVWAGRPGLTAEAAAAEYADKFAAGNYDLIVMEIGTNDWSQVPVEKFSQTYPALIKAVKAGSPNAAMLCLGAWGDGSKTGPFDMVIKPTCTTAGAKFRSLNGAFLPSGNIWQTGYRDDGTKVDIFHPSDKGHAAIADVILGALRIS